MFAQGRWHRRYVREQAGKYGPIRGNDGILRVEHIERRRAGVRVDHDLHAIADEVDSLIAKRVASRVWVAIGRREGVHQPVDPAILTDYDVGVGIEGKKRGEFLDAFSQVTTHQQSTVRSYIVAERQFRKIAAIERNQHTTQEATQPDATIALVRGEVIGVALRIIEFFLASLDVDV